MAGSTLRPLHRRVRRNPALCAYYAAHHLPARYAHWRGWRG